MTSQKYLPDQGCRLAILPYEIVKRRDGTLLPSVDYCLAFHSLLKGCGGGTGFTVNYFIVLGLDACDCTADEVLFQVVNDACDFADLKEGEQRIG